MESINELLGRGFSLWRDNLNLCLPHLLGFFFSLMALFAGIMAVIFSGLLPLEGLNETALQEMQYVEDMEEMQVFWDQMEEHLASLQSSDILQMASAILAVFVLIALVDAFFAAGAIGMARQALEKGRSSTSAMWSAGRRHFLGMFLAELLMTFIILMGILLLLPLLGSGLEKLGLLAVALALIAIFYALALTIILSTMPYALVLEDLPPLRALRASIDFFRYNKFDVGVLWLVVLALSLGLQMVSGAISSGQPGQGQPLSAITGMISLLVLAPLSNLWWTRLYMSRKGMLKQDEKEDPW
ncbi:MAG TPA: hypothetical protein PKG66_05600 [Methanothrix sp.]|nr:hypothetical protein [Methanothrix sp.]HNU40436.1 hypothetical protein [Methanothrix sp.]